VTYSDPNCLYKDSAGKNCRVCKDGYYINVGGGTSGGTAFNICSACNDFLSILHRLNEPDPSCIVSHWNDFSRKML
jgi:hypothetical protein